MLCVTYWRRRLAYQKEIIRLLRLQCEEGNQYPGILEEYEEAEKQLRSTLELPCLQGYPAPDNWSLFSIVFPFIILSLIQYRINSVSENPSWSTSPSNFLSLMRVVGWQVLSIPSVKLTLLLLPFPASIRELVANRQVQIDGHNRVFVNYVLRVLVIVCKPYPRNICGC